MNIRGDLIIKMATEEKEFETGAALFTYNEPWLTYKKTYEHSLRKVKEKNSELYVAVIGDEIVGAILIQLRGQLNGFIRSWCIAEGYREMGIGTKLLTVAEKRILQEAPNVFMYVSSHNELGRNLYTRLGYEQIGLFKDYILEGYDEYLLRKSICSMNTFEERKQS